MSDYSPIYIQNTSGIAVPVGANNPMPIGSQFNIVTVDSSGHLFVRVENANTVPIAAGVATNTTVRSGVTRYYGVLIIATGTNPFVIFDNAGAASGTVLDIIPASAPVGTFHYFPNGILTVIGITTQGNAANPQVTVYCF